MKIIEKVVRYIKCPARVIVRLNDYKIGELFSDEFFLKCLYKARTGKRLNIKSPRTFNEKIQWLKLHDRKPEYTEMVDKYAVKEYVSKRIGEEYVIISLGVWNNFDEIDFDKLPEQFVLKCTHSGGVVICRDKSRFDKEAAKETLERSLKINYYNHAREWQYKNVPPRILAEEFINDQKNENLIVYKVFCFDGKPELIQVIQDDKTPNESIDYFDTSWNLLELRQNFPNSQIHLEKPDRYEEMLELSAKLSEGKAFLRVDWYVSNGKLLFSEFTFHSDAGVASFHPEEWDYKLGELIDLSNVNSIKEEKR